MRETIGALKEAGLRERLKVMVGGAPITQAYTDEIGADAMGASAVLAADRTKELTGVKV